MNANLISTDESFDYFLEDAIIRSFDCRDWINQEIETLDTDIKKGLCDISSRRRAAFKEVYQIMVDKLFDSVIISNNDVHLNPISVKFHPRFGWFIIANSESCKTENKIFLGKMSLLDGAKIVMGRKTYISGVSAIRGGGLLTVGSFCSFATNLYITTAYEDHPMEYAAMLGRNGNPRFDEDWIDESFQFAQTERSKKSVTIGSDVWIGKNAVISSGIEIGDGCVIAQGSIVKDDCKPYGIYAGYPAKLKRYRFSEDHIRELLDIQWWNWSLDLIKKNSVFFNTNLKFYKGNIMDILKI